ncbi:hypothetical protein KY359_00825 [Candidatus Woesearchaeota archaeon]|nr:hypothetical protein [Candidatus Woesearchaeota archaeon]
MGVEETCLQYKKLNRRFPNRRYTRNGSDQLVLDVEGSILMNDYCINSYARDFRMNVGTLREELRQDLLREAELPDNREWLASMSSSSYRSEPEKRTRRRRRRKHADGGCMPEGMEPGLDAIDFEEEPDTVVSATEDALAETLARKYA